MGRIEKTVFISYRRTNLPWALCIYQDLTSHGYDVFFDYLSIDSGNFEKAIVENIKAHAHFLVILTPSALERCKEPGDWLRREIETAIDEKRNIIPFMLEGFDFGSQATAQTLTGKLATLNTYNGLSIYSEYFFAAMEKLRNRFLSVALEDVRLQPLTAETKESNAAQKIAASEAPPVEKEALTAQEWYERGYKIIIEAGNFNEAIRCFSEALYLDSNDAFVYGMRGTAYGAKGNYDDALTDLNTAIHLKSDEATFYGSRGLVHQQKGNFGEALADYTEAIRLMPDYAGAYNERAGVYRDKGDFDKAIDDWHEGIRLEPDNASTLHNRGVAHQLKGDFDVAYKDYAAAVELKPDNGSYRSSLMSMLRKLGRNEEADEQEKKARELISKDTEYNQACFESICGNTDKALELLKIAMEKKTIPKRMGAARP